MLQLEKSNVMSDLLIPGEYSGKIHPHRIFCMMWYNVKFGCDLSFFFPNQIAVGNVIQLKCTDNQRLLVSACAHNEL